MKLQALRTHDNPYVTLPQNSPADTGVMLVDAPQPHGYYTPWSESRCSGLLPVSRRHVKSELIAAMEDDTIGMEDMFLIFEVTDDLGIDREQVSVPLGKEDPGAVRLLDTGEVEIVVPVSVPLKDWTETLRAELVSLGLDTNEEE